MKYLIATLLILLVGCKDPTAPIPPYSPGGKFYMATGTFVGTWEPVVNGSTVDTNVCTAIITEADSIVMGTITNATTGEVITVKGSHDLPANIDGIPEYHLYSTQYASSLGDTGSSRPLNFLDGNGFSLTCELKLVPSKDTADVWIDCARQ